MSRIYCSSICLQQLLCPVRWLLPQWTHRGLSLVNSLVGWASAHFLKVHPAVWQYLIGWKYCWHFLHIIGLSLYGYTFVNICSSGMLIVSGRVSLLKVRSQAVWSSRLGLIHLAFIISDTWYFAFIPSWDEDPFSMQKSLIYTSPLLLLNILWACAVQARPIRFFISIA